MLKFTTCFIRSTTDAYVAKINWLYYKMALDDPRITTIFNFGAWVWSPNNTTTALSTTLPITGKAQRLMGRAITSF